MKKLLLLMVFVIGCTKEDKTNNTVADLPSVIIGSQTWTTKNLDVTSYRDGTPIPQERDATQWKILTTGAWCYYNNTTANGTTYGKLYNWYAVAGIHDTDANTPNKTLAPTGYHVPTNAEWTTLTTYLGGESIAGEKMKATTGWESHSGITNTNASGFTGLPGGSRYIDGTFDLIGNYGFWWSFSEQNNSAGKIRLDSNLNSAYTTTSFDKKNGLSVRCLKD